MKLAQRFQALGLVLALLALPLAVLAGVYACAPQSSVMLCCPAHRGHSMNRMHMNGNGSDSGSSLCAVKCNSQSSPEFSLIAPLPPTQLSSIPELPAPDSTEAVRRAHSPHVYAGYLLLPFRPPRS
ncbi:MAG TPA: hypothetical protein VGR72_01075 [Candidatus Acidoferrales bacterium]|nr:hypothetical protein [Candidatus Acidoferrales bacterium]